MAVQAYENIRPDPEQTHREAQVRAPDFERLVEGSGEVRVMEWCFAQGHAEYAPKTGYVVQDLATEGMRRTRIAVAQFCDELGSEDVLAERLNISTNNASPIDAGNPNLTCVQDLRASVKTAA